MHILSILDIKKMIPVPNGCYERIEFDELDDIRYKDLFEKGGKIISEAKRNRNYQKSKL